MQLFIIWLFCDVFMKGIEHGTKNIKGILISLLFYVVSIVYVSTFQHGKHLLLVQNVCSRVNNLSSHFLSNSTAGIILKSSKIQNNSNHNSQNFTIKQLNITEKETLILGRWKLKWLKHITNAYKKRKGQEFPRFLD